MIFNRLSQHNKKVRNIKRDRMLRSDETPVARSTNNNDRLVKKEHIMNSRNNSTIISAYDSDVGKVRENMEDSMYINKEMGLFIVADGMGGHEGGEIASEIAVNETSNFLKEKLPIAIHESNKGRKEKDKEYRTLKKIFSKALKISDQRILEEAENSSSLQGMGTTIVYSYVPSGNTDTFYITNLGDSRAYLIGSVVQHSDHNELQSQIRIKQLTEDHSVAAQMVKKNYLSEEEARTSKYKHMLTQSLGSYVSSSKPYIKKFEWNKGDYLLLCSDGLTDMLDDSEICSIVLNHNDKSSEKTEEITSVNEEYRNVDEEYLLEEKCKALVRKANERGGRDNITVILVQNKPDQKNITDKNNRINNNKNDSNYPDNAQSPLQDPRILDNTTKDGNDIVTRNTDSVTKFSSNNTTADDGSNTDNELNSQGG